MIRFLLFISSFFPCINVYADSCTEHQCIAVVDAGSTGSRLHIFAYDMDDTNTPTGIQEIWSKKINPGFATIDPKPAVINTYLRTLFTGAPARNMPVYFYATAGMRLVSQSKQKIYYQALNHWFKAQSEWRLKTAKTLSGREEALYDWLAVNYHIGNLNSSFKEPVGVMDIGGASVQIVFPIQRNTDNKTAIELKLYGKSINLSVHSFLGLGQNEMAHQLLDTPSCFAKGYPLADGSYGEGEVMNCVEEIAPLINLHKVSNELTASLADNQVSSWYAIGGFPYVAEKKPFYFANNQVTIQDLLQQANNLICHQSWKDLTNDFPNNEYIEFYCLLPAFYSALMINGYGLSADQLINYIPSAQNLDWTLGVALHH